MPELPEVETVRRGLEPAMEGARFTKVEVRRGDLRWPLPKDFVTPGRQTVTGIGRRAKYLLADLSSGDVLVMHLGMSGSFHVFAGNGRTRQRRQSSAAIITSARKHVAHDHVVFHMSSGAIVTFNDPRRFGSMKILPRATTRRRTAAQRARSRAARQRFRRRHAGARLQRQEDEPEGRAARPERRGGPRQHLRLRGAVSRAALAETHGRDDRHQDRRAERARERLVEGIKAVLNDAIKAGGSSLRDHKRTDGDLGMFQHHFRVYDREGEKCPTPGCRGTVKRIVQNGRSTFFCPVVRNLDFSAPEKCQ